MGIYIELYAISSGRFYEKVRDKLQFCISALKFFQGGLFSLQDGEIWLYAPSEALGGTLHSPVKATDPYSAGQTIEDALSALPYDELSQAIVMFNGVWDFGEIKTGGYFSVNYSPDWRQAYHDIEIGAYAKKDFADLVDFLWITQPMESLSQKFIATMRETGVNRTLGLSTVFFSRGVPTDEDPTNLLGVHLDGDRKALLRIFYRALSQTEDPEVASRIPALNSSFFITTIAAEEIVNERLDKEMEEVMIIERKGDSTTFIAKNADSFAKLYDEVSKTILKPGLADLPTAKSVKNWIESGLKKSR